MLWSFFVPTRDTQRVCRLASRIRKNNVPSVFQPFGRGPASLWKEHKLGSYRPGPVAQRLLGPYLPDTGSLPQRVARCRPIHTKLICGFSGESAAAAQRRKRRWPGASDTGGELELGGCIKAPPRANATYLMHPAPAARRRVADLIIKNTVIRVSVYHASGSS